MGADEVKEYEAVIKKFLRKLKGDERKEAKKIIDKYKGKIVSAGLSKVYDYELKGNPALVLELDDGDFVVVYKLYGEVMEDREYNFLEEELFDEYGVFILGEKKENDYLIIPMWLLDNSKYWNRFVYLRNGEKIVGSFKGNIGVVEDMDVSEIEDELREITDVLKSYTWVSSDSWRGSYEGKNRIKGFVKVVEGWAGMGGSDKYVEKLSKLSSGEIKPPVDPVLFVFPLSSNVTVIYFDVFVKEKDVDRFLQWLGLREGHYYGDGNVNVLRKKH